MRPKDNATELTHDDAWFNLNGHFDAVIDSIFNDHIYDAYVFQVLTTMAAFGEPLAAEFLADAYRDGEFHENLDPQPMEELRWSLIQKFLEGDDRWKFHACDSMFSAISAEESDRVVEEVRDWIKVHPVARSAAYCAQEKCTRHLYYYPKD